MPYRAGPGACLHAPSFRFASLGGMSSGATRRSLVTGKIGRRVCPSTPRSRKDALPAFGAVASLSRLCSPTAELPPPQERQEGAVSESPRQELLQAGAAISAFPHSFYDLAYPSLYLERSSSIVTDNYLSPLWESFFFFINFHSSKPQSNRYSWFSGSDNSGYPIEQTIILSSIILNV